MDSDQYNGYEKEHIVNDIKELKKQLRRIEYKIEHLHDIVIMMIIILIYLYISMIMKN
jgi:hypothetical protein